MASPRSKSAYEYCLRTPSPKRSSQARQQCLYSDRLIPSRAASWLTEGFGLLDENAPQQPNGNVAAETPAPGENSSAAYDQLLRSELFGKSSPLTASTQASKGEPEALRTPERGNSLFRYKSSLDSTLSQSDDTSLLSSPSLRCDASDPPSARKPSRRVPKDPVRVLFAPELEDDFYLNLVDWSSSDVVAVALGTMWVALWSARTMRVTMFRTSPAASLAWGEGSLCNQLAVGTRTGEVELWDAATGHLVRSMGGQDRRVATLAWCGNILSSGSKNGIVVHRDMRDPSRSIGEAHGHAEEICGLQWSPDQQQLASGGNEGLVCVWSMRSPKPEARIAEHEAAVKALAWSPHQRGLLATGGGTSDRCIRFWSSVHQATLDCVPAGSQVCNLAWGRYSNELVSTHGYNSHQVMLWKYPCMKQLAVLNGHTSRVLYLATAPDGQHIVTGAGDETLQFWNVFSGPRSGSSSSASAVTNRQPMPSLCRTIR